MRFWDSSAVLPLLTTKPSSETVLELLREDDEIAAWWGTWVECAVALNRFVREGRFSVEAGEEARALLDQLTQDWSEVQPTNEARSLAARLSERYPLKAADTLQLAAALRWCEGDTEGRVFMCLDNRLRSAAVGEGFRVLPELPDDDSGSPETDSEDATGND